MKILITGSTGFLGSWACRILSRNHEVIGLCRNNSNQFRLNGIKNFQSIPANPIEWSEVISKHLPDVIIFLHWDGVANQQRNSDIQKANINFFTQLIETSVRTKVKKIIGIGSQAELGPLEIPISDLQQDNPTTLYGSTKIECRENGFELCKNTETKFIWGRVFSTYGPLDSTSWLIPSAIISLNKSEQFLSTSGKQNWSFLHAYDFAKAIQKLIEIDSKKSIFNIGNPSTNLIRDVLQLIENMLGKSNLIQFGKIPYRADQVMRLEPKCEGLLELGWTPNVNLYDGLKQTIDWYVGKPEKPLRTISNELEFFNLPDRT